MPIKRSAWQVCAKHTGMLEAKAHAYQTGGRQHDLTSKLNNLELAAGDVVMRPPCIFAMQLFPFVKPSNLKIHIQRPYRSLFCLARPMCTPRAPLLPLYCCRWCLAYLGTCSRKPSVVTGLRSAGAEHYTSIHNLGIHYGTKRLPAQ